MADTWLIDETAALSKADSDEASLVGYAFDATGATSPLGVLVHDVVIRSTHRLFGAAADIRLDAIVVTVPSADGSTGLYQPNTFRFPSVRRDDQLPIDTGGMLLYLGQPRFFLDLAIMASPADNGAPDLADLIKDNAKDVGEATSTIATLAIASPQAMAIGAAATAAGSLAALALRLLQQRMGKTIGLYRTTWFEQRDSFGAGRHPDAGSFRASDLEFWYDIFRDAPPGG